MTRERAPTPVILTYKLLYYEHGHARSAVHLHTENPH